MLTQYLLLWLLFFLPLFFPPIFTDLYDLPKVLFFFFLSFLIITSSSLFVLKKRVLSLPNKNFLILLSLFFSAYLISTALSIHKLTSLIGLWDIKYSTYTGGLVHLSALLLLFFAILQLRPKGKLLSTLTIYLTASATLVSVYGIVRYIEKFFKNNPGYRIRSTIGEPNRLAFFLIAVLPLSISLFLKQKRALYKFFSFLACVVILGGIILTFSRAAWIVLLILTSINLLFNLKNLKNLLIENKAYLLAFLCFIIFASISHGKLLVSRVGSVADDLKMQKGSTYIRLLEWQTGFEIFRDQSLIRKIVGTGPETLKFTYPQFRPVKLNKFYPEKTWKTSVLRNQYLHYLNTIGVIGTLLFLTIIIYVLQSYLKNKNKKTYQKAFFYAWLAIILSGIFYYQTITTHCYFWVFTAIVLGTGGLNKIKFNKPLLPRIILVTTIILSTLGSIAVFSISRSLIYAKQKKFQKAIKATPFFDFLWREHSFGLQNIALKENNQEIIKKAIIAAEKALKINALETANLPCLHAALYKASGYLNMNKKYQKQALIIAQEWTKLDPSRPEPLDALGLSYLDLGRSEEALEYFKKALAFDPDYLESYLHAGEALKQMGKIDKAIDYYELALGKKPNWPFAQQELEKAQSLLDKE